MNALLHRAGVALLLSCAAAAATAAPPPIKSAGDACESAVAETVRRMRGRDAQEVQFIGAKRALSPAPDGDETGVKGEGRYRGVAGRPVPFSYSCAFNTKTGATNGVVFKETGAALAGAEALWQPDLANLSPEACEAATAAALKDKHPRVGRIVFDSGSRALRPAPNARTRLEGQGAVERAPGMNAIPFSYHCEFEARSGKVLSVQTTD
jgi:hypothetical protein